VADSKKLILCPYCGNTQDAPEERCSTCGGFFDSLSLKVTQQHMGPWFVRDRHNPFRPGCTYEVLTREIEKGKIKPTTIIRGPTTRQFWSVARNVPGVAHLLGYCHACGAHVSPGADNCPECGEVFYAPRQRDQLGLAPIGADVQAVPQLSDTGAYQTVGSTATSSGAAAGASGAAGASQAPGRSGTGATGGYGAADTAGGSSILAGLRPRPEDAPVEAATAQATASRDAMAWMTSTGSEEPDTLATAGDATAPVPRSTRGGGTNVWTWVLIMVNVVLLAAAVAAVIIGVGQTMTAGPSEGQPTQTPGTPAQADDGGDAQSAVQDGGSDATGGAEQGSGRFEPPDFADVGEPNEFGTDAAQAPNDRAGPATPEPAPAPAPSPDEPAADANTGDQRPPATVWAERFEQALELEDNGELEKARDLLRRIKTDAPTGARPEDLDKAIERVEDNLNRRKLEDFFGQP